MVQLNKFSLLFFLAVCFTISGFAQNDHTEAKLPPPIKEGKNDKKDSEKKIEQYWLVILKTGPKKDIDSVTKAKLFEGHMANMERLYYEGVLKVAGPFGRNEFKWRGLFIFDCKTKEEVERFVATDPAIAAGIFEVDILSWYSEPIGSFIHGKPDKPTD